MRIARVTNSRAMVSFGRNPFGSSSKPSSSSTSTSTSSSTKFDNFSYAAASSTSSSKDSLRRGSILQKTLGFTKLDSIQGGKMAANDDNNGEPLALQRGDKIVVEVINFGKLGASVKVIGRGALDDDANWMGRQQQHQQPIELGRGLILQKEIHYFRLARGGIDIVRGEILPAYVENIRDDGKIDISLRPPGGMAKSRDVSATILDLLRQSDNGILTIGDKSSPEEINAILPGTSKLAFKKAVSALYKQKKIMIQPTSITLAR
jgi:hypothetical protein